MGENDWKPDAYKRETNRRASKTLATISFRQAIMDEHIYKITEIVGQTK